LEWRIGCAVRSGYGVVFRGGYGGDLRDAVVGAGNAVTADPETTELAAGSPL
jgi:hypothetical protein